MSMMYLKKILNENLKAGRHSRWGKARQKCWTDQGNINVWFMICTLFAIINSACRLLMHQKGPQRGVKFHPITLTPFFVPFHFHLVLISHQTNWRKLAVPIIETFLKPEPPPAPQKSLTASCHLQNFLSIAEITHVHHVISTSVHSLKCTVSDEHVACLLCGNIRALNSSPLTSETQFQALATSSTRLDAWLGVNDVPQNEVPWVEAWETHPSESLLYLLASFDLWPLPCLPWWLAAVGAGPGELGQTAASWAAWPKLETHAQG